MAEETMTTESTDSPETVTEQNSESVLKQRRKKQNFIIN
mgnify:CR=1 FL=1